MYIYIVMFDLYKRELIYATKQKKLKKITLPSVFTSALGKASTSRMLGKVFAECQVKNTRQSLQLCREPDPRHTAKLEPLPSALDLSLGKSWRLCRVSSVWHSAKLAHSVGGRLFCFILPS